MSLSTPAGLLRNRTGSPPERNSVPAFDDGKKPLPQHEFPPLGPLLPLLKTTNPGKSFDSLPSPYVTQAPVLGLPNCWLPVSMKICAGAWLNASVTIDLTMAISSTTSPRLGS